jgi:hypothetical protein
LVALTGTAWAAPLDKSANAKIDEAINVHYLSTDFDKAEGLLKGTLKACGERCSAPVKARAWMYIGIVRGAGHQDLDGAGAAFMEALGLDPNVQLDGDLATEELQALFAESGGAMGAGGGTEPFLTPDSGPAGPPMGMGGGGGMQCTPSVAEVETRRPIPVACTTPEPASRAVLYYKEFGAQKWTQANMGKAGDSWLAQIPCSATGIQGTLSWYAIATSIQGQPVDSFGSEAAPNQVALVQSTAAPPPAYPGKPAPSRCSDMAECPPDMRGTPSCPDTSDPGGLDAEGGGSGGWGDSCTESSDCQSELTCMEGTCESPPSCETDADCSSGTCEDFLCAYDGGSGGADADAPRNLIGIQIGLDLAQMSGVGICNPLAKSTYRCYLGDIPYAPSPVQYAPVLDANGVQTVDANGFPEFAPTDQPSWYHNPTHVTNVHEDGTPWLDPATGMQTLVSTFDKRQSGEIGSALAPSTLRVMLTYERLVSAKIGVEGRAGAAFGGAPDTGFANLLHLSLRGKYWFSGTGPGLRLFGLLGVGMGQVDAKKPVTIAEHGINHSPVHQAYCGGDANCFLEVTAYKSLGTTFVTGGIGAFLNLGGHGPSVEVNGRIMFPESGFVIQPTGGWLIGF